MNCTVADRESVLSQSLAFLNLRILSEMDNIDLDTDTKLVGIVTIVYITIFYHSVTRYSGESYW